MISKMLSRLFFCSILLAIGGSAYAEQASVSIKAIEENVKQAMKTFDVPGVAVAIVKDDKVVMAKGFGVKRLGSKGEVNADTLFGIASNTKAFTAAAIAVLVDEGKLSWDDKVVDLLPGFKLYDPYVTAQLTVRDMLSHRSGLGLGAGDLMIWPSSNVTNEEILKKIQHIKPASSMRSKYAYNNIMFVLAGEVVAKVSGMSWEDFVRSRILNPLSMNHSRMKFSRISKDNTNVASPHVPVEGVLEVVGGDFLENFLAAGSMASSVNDMSQWLKVQLNGGLIGQQAEDELRLFSARQQQQMWHPNVMNTVSEFDKEHFNTHFRGYGLGWGLNDYHGYKVVSHTGGILGMVSRVALVPELKLGMVVLTNQQSGSAFMAITNDILNRYIKGQSKDWVSIYDKRLKELKAKTKAELEKVMNERDSQSKPSLPLKSYAQTYRDDWYGDIEVSYKGQKNANALSISFSRTPELVGVLEHFQHNTFIVRWHNRAFEADAFINFQLNHQGEVETATMKAISDATDFSFDFADLSLKPKI